MTGSKTDFVRDIQELESVVFVCFGQPKGDELPQIASPDEVVIGLIQSSTGRPHELVDAQIHHQLDPSYEGDTQ